MFQVGPLAKYKGDECIVYSHKRAAQNQIGIAQADVLDFCKTCLSKSPLLV